ncbi:MAG: hypothetical protein LC637_14500 [Xanthomonadaceae bacterium]|nr:hypothetical protein [Xanthomonadaceae bacterium]
MLPSPKAVFANRLSTLVLLVAVIALIGILPARPLLPAVWPRPVEELVLPDGRWVFRPAPWHFLAAGADESRARTRPLSLLQVQLSDGSNEHGYIVAQSSGSTGTLILQTGPGQQRSLPVSSVAFMFYPNDLPLGQRVRLARGRLQERLPFSRMPSHHESALGR